MVLNASRSRSDFSMKDPSAPVGCFLARSVPRSRCSVMSPRLLVLVALLSSSSGESSASGSETVLAFVGQHVVLPCGYNVGVHDDVPTVEWSKKGLKDLVILYRNGCEDHDMKNPAYLYRTSLITPELKNGNISVRIADVRLSDDGLYYCKRLWETGQPDNTAVQLRVVAVSEPALSVVSPGSGWSLQGGETLQCDATCWLPKPEIHFLDDQGRVIPAETEPKWSREAGECYSVTQRVTLQSPTERVTCRVVQPETNQSRLRHISVPARYQGPWITVKDFVLGLSLFLNLILGLVICGIFCRRNPCSCAAAQKQPATRQSSEQSSSSADSSWFNRTTETLTREDSAHQGRSDAGAPRLSPVVLQHDQPTLVPTPVFSPSSSPTKQIPQNPGPKPGTSRQNPARCHSLPGPGRRPSLDALSSSSQSAVKALKKTRSFSDSSGARVPNLRRQSSITLSQNRFSILSGLNEESEHLMSEK